MGKEFPLARSEEEGRSVLLAISSSRESICTSCIRDERTQEPGPAKGNCGEEVEDTETKSKSSRKTERANASSPKKDRRGGSGKDRKSDRRDEGKNKPVRRSASELGITFPGSYCDELETVPHYWVEVDNVYRGSLFQCKLCLKHLWVPRDWTDVEHLATAIKHYGGDEGYCRYLNKHRAAKMLMAKLQDLRRLEKEVVDKREFAKLTDKILSDKEYDREENVDNTKEITTNPS